MPPPWFSMSNDIRNKGRSRNWIDSEPDWKKWISFKLRAFTQCTFSFSFFLQFVTFLFCFVLVCCSFNFPSWYQFTFVSFKCLNFSHNYDNYSMFRDVPEYSMFLVLSRALFLLDWRQFYPKTGRCALTNQRSPGYPLGTDLSNYAQRNVTCG